MTFDKSDKLLDILMTWLTEAPHGQQIGMFLYQQLSPQIPCGKGKAETST